MSSPARQQSKIQKRNVTLTTEYCHSSVGQLEWLGGVLPEDALKEYHSKMQRFQGCGPEVVGGAPLDTAEG